MPVWKISGCWFFFKVGEVLEKHKGIHIHAETSRGGVSFWIKKNGIKSKYKVELKQVEGYVSDFEKNKVEKIIRERIDFFVEEWKNIEKRVKN